LVRIKTVSIKDLSPFVFIVVIGTSWNRNAEDASLSRATTTRFAIEFVDF
jgi:hypothetical protein